MLAFLFLKFTNLNMMNPIEIQARQYYIHSGYVPVYYYVYESLENWIANTIFRQDRSRVFLASNEYVFRRRFELTDMTRSFRDLEASSLHFPFANYWPLNVSWSAEDRVAANPAALLYEGINTSRSRIKASNANLSIPVTFYFDREDDARFAYSTLYFYTFNEFNYETSITFQNEEVGLPVVISIKSLQFNPQYNEKDWLKQNRIFIVSATLNVRTYLISPPDQPIYTQSIEGDGFLSNGDTYSTGADMYNLVHTVETSMSSMRDLSEESIQKLIYEGEVEEPEVLVNYLRQVGSTEDTVEIEWEVDNVEDIAAIEVKLAIEKDYTEISPTATSYLFRDLAQGSSYPIYVKFTLKSGTSKRLSLVIRTREADPEDNTSDPLVGISW